MLYEVITGGGCVEDLETLGADPGFQEMLRHLMTTGLTRGQRRRYRRRFRRGGERAVPSTSATRRYLEGFVEDAAEEGRGQGQAVITSYSIHYTKLYD